MSETKHLETLHLRFRAIDAQVREIQSANRNPLEERRRAVVTAMLDQGETPALLAEFAKVEGALKAEDPTKRARLDKLLGQRAAIQQQIDREELASRSAESAAQRAATIEAAEAIQPLAIQWQRAADALVDATEALYAAQEVVGREAIGAVRTQHRGQEQHLLDALVTVGTPARGRTALHAGAIAEIFKRVATIFGDAGRMKDFISANEWSPKTQHMTMIDACALAVSDLREKLGVSA